MKWAMEDDEGKRSWDLIFLNSVQTLKIRVWPSATYGERTRSMLVVLGKRHIPY